MTVLYISNPFPIFLDKNGKALQNGYIYIGSANSNPETSPINVYFDAALTIPAPNPVRTINGYPSRNGTPAQLFTSENCSITVKGKQKNLVFNAALVYAQNSIAVTVESIADLRLVATGLDGLAISTLGYYSAGDGGSNQFYWDASSSETDNAATVVKPTATVGNGRWLALNPMDVTMRKWGCKGDGSTDDTARLQAAIDFCYNSHADEHPVVKVGIGRYSITQVNMRNHVRIVGENESTSHSDVALSLGYGSEFIQPAGTNLDMFLWNILDDGGAISDAGIEYCSIRGGWTGIGDATTTSGSAIKFDGCTPTQGVRIGNLLIANFAEDAVELTRHALPNTMYNIWGRKLGGFVLHVKTIDGRISHMFSADKIQGDFLVSGLIKVDESSFTGTNSGSAETYLFINCKHEIDSSATSTTAYSPNTFIFNDVDRAVVTLINCDTQPSNPLGGGTPDTNAVLKITGSKTPYFNIIGCRMGSSNAVSDYLVDDTVRGIKIGKRNRNARYLSPEYNLIVSHASTNIIEDTRQLNDDTGVMDGFARFKRDAAGKMQWSDGTTPPDANLYRAAEGRLVSDFGIQAKKLMARGGTQLQASDFALSAGWGNAASVAVDAVSASNHDQRFRIIVTCNGSGIAANPTVTLTFVDGIFASGQKWAVPPVAVCAMGSESTGAIAQISTGARSINTLVMRYNSTPSAGLTYVIDCVLIG